MQHYYIFKRQFTLIVTNNGNCTHMWDRHKKLINQFTPK